jgi:Ca-activated chloride channel family protein
MDILPVLRDEAESARVQTESVGAEAGFGALRVEMEGRRVALPLAALEVRTRLDGLVARTEVRQTYVNPYRDPVEATYLFPLPDRAAVTRFRLEVAGRVVDGELQERAAARQTYDQAIQAGHRAAIAEEERPGVFTLRVGNLPPGERAVVSLHLVGTLPVRIADPGSAEPGGEVTFRFPLVVAPRYIPGHPLPGAPVGRGVSPDTDAVPDASRISPPVLLPGFPDPVRLSLAVEVSASLDPHAFQSSLHTVVEERGPGGYRFLVQPGERLNRDFILRYRLGRGTLQSSLTLEPDHEGSGGTFLLTLLPPAGPGGMVPARDIVFVLDRSGSTQGWKMVTARRAVARLVEALTDRDRFAVYAFDNRIETPPGSEGLNLSRATDGQRYRAARFLDGLESRGGTVMAGPLQEAVRVLSTREGNSGEGSRARVLVLITDGQVGNEDQLLRVLGPQLQGVRIFTLGIDQAVNAAFLRRLADMSGGTCELIESESRLSEVMDHVQRQIGTPILTDLGLTGQGISLVPDSLVPGRLPDLFPGSPVLVSGRYQGGGKARLLVGGRLAASSGGNWSAEVEAWREDHQGASSLWARGRVRELEDRYVIGIGDRAALEREIVATSLRYGVLSRFTAYVAVDRSGVVNPGGWVHQVTQAVEQPEGWKNRALGGVMWTKACLADTEEGEEMMFGCVEFRNPDPQAQASFRRGKAKASRAEQEPGQPRSGLGILAALGQAVRSLFGRVETDQSQVDGAAAVPESNRAAVRQRAQGCLDRLVELPGQTAADRLVLLRSVAAELAQLIQDLRAMNVGTGTASEPGRVPEEVIRTLELALEWMRADSTTPLQEDGIQQVWQDIRQALQSLLQPGGAPGATREAFWK